LGSTTFRAIKQWRNKCLGLFSRMLSKCKKGSRRYKRLLRAKARMKAKTANQLRDLFHQATRKAINHCTAQGICELIIGDPKGVEKDTKKKKRLSRKSRQKVSQMEYGRIKQQLSYKAREQGVSVQYVKEHNTTKQCPACGKTNTCTGRNYQCSCGFVGHRDGKAAFMILRKKYPELPLPEFSMKHIQCVPKYRKREIPACVVGPWRGPSRLVKPAPCETV
jgi:putative transposase